MAGNDHDTAICQSVLKRNSLYFWKFEVCTYEINNWLEHFPAMQYINLPMCTNWWHIRRCPKIRQSTLTCFIYILDSSNSSSFTFWTSQFTSSSRCNWTGISTGNSNGSWTDKHSSHFSTAKGISLEATFFFVKSTTNKFWNDAEMLY